MLTRKQYSPPRAQHTRRAIISTRCNPTPQKTPQKRHNHHTHRRHTMFSARQIALANAESRVGAWSDYVYRAEVAKDFKRYEYGQLRLANARARLKRLLKP